MDKKLCLFALIFIAVFMFACHRGGKGDRPATGDTGKPRPVIDSPYKAKVSEVFNDTRQVYDVDVIGTLWEGIEESLKKRGMLWDQKAGGEPYVFEGHILNFKKGSIGERFLPRMGDTVLAVRVDLSRGGVHIATIESKHKIAFGRGTLTRNAWRKVFDEVSEDVVEQAVKKF